MSHSLYSTSKCAETESEHKSGFSRFDKPKFGNFRIYFYQLVGPTYLLFWLDNILTRFTAK